MAEITEANKFESTETKEISNVKIEEAPKQGPYIANVGVVNDYMNVTSSDSFGKRTPLRYFYNTKQNFREDYSQIREFEN